MEMKAQGRRNRGIPKRRRLDNVKDEIKKKGMYADECTTELHGGVCHRTSNENTTAIYF